MSASLLLLWALGCTGGGADLEAARAELEALAKTEVDGQVRTSTFGLMLEDLRNWTEKAWSRRYLELNPRMNPGSGVPTEEECADYAEDYRGLRDIRAIPGTEEPR